MYIMIDSGVESKMGKNNKSIYYYSTVFGWADR